MRYNAHRGLGNFTHSYSNTVTISSAGGDFSTIQAALNANPFANTLFLVYPGTYTNDTIYFTANSQWVKGIGTEYATTVTQATTNICNVAAYTGCGIEQLTLTISGTTSAVGNVLASTGNLVVRSCVLNLTNSSVATVGQPYCISVTGAGTVNVFQGEINYTNTVASDPAAVKTAISLGTGCTVNIRRVISTLSGSGASGVHTLAYGTSTGICNIFKSWTSVTDTAAANVAGIYLNGSSTTNQCAWNRFVVAIGAANIGSAIKVGTTSLITSSSNYIDVTGSGTKYAFSVGAGSTVYSNFDIYSSTLSSLTTGTLNAVNCDVAGNLVATTKTTTPKVRGSAADGASAVAVSIGSTAAYSTTGAKLAQFTNNEVEKVFIDKDGNASLLSGYIITGTLPTGSVALNNYGLYTPTTTHTLGLWSTRADGANNVAVGVVADLNNATINTDYKILRAGWLDNSDTYTEVMNLKSGGLELTSESSAEVLSSEINNPDVVAVTVGTENVFTLPTVASGLLAPRATLLSVVNGSPGTEKFAVDVTGNVCYNELPNAQAACLKSLSEELTIAAAATTDTANAVIPSGTLVYAVSSRVTTVLPGASTYSIGVVGATTRYGTSLLGAAGASWKGIEAGVVAYNADTPIRITPSATPTGATGKIRITIHYVDITAPTS